MADQTFDLVVLGGGSGGYAAAIRASQLGLSVGLIEKSKLGGTCLHVGCIPTKALLHAAEVADVTREAGKYGVSATLGGVDIAGVTTYRQEVVASKWKGLQGLIKARGITVIAGEGRLTSPTTVEVAGETITGKNVILATGSYSRSLPGLELGGRVITSEQALELSWIPKKVAVLGGGVIGVEFSSV
ncbi:MAG: FAD-dependent oxidoreductase, partial [Aeromicrobium sp.]